jgi:hypothetical protein
VITPKLDRGAFLSVYEFALYTLRHGLHVTHVPHSVAHCFGRQVHRPDLDKLDLRDGVTLWQSLANG